ncbi:hypothetical protein KAR91_24020 [Candidatus Pacearchaeota archaeon]|nr:hypothetical protein [Candidatus Pacearchaeota archaeon]
MKPFPNIKDTIAAKDWNILVKNTLPVNIADIYSFSEAMHIIDHLIEASVDQMVEDGFTADLMRDYSVNLMKILRAKYPQDWKKDWKNEAFLGIVCGLVFREEEAFIHIQKAYERLEDPPQALILAYISAGSGPDHFLTKDQIAELSQSVIEKGVTYESALHMASLAYDQRDFEKQKYWEAKASEAKEKGVHTPCITPDVLKTTSKEEEGEQYEE